MQVFLSHSHRDRDFVDKLATSLRKADFDVWLDRAELKVGDNLVKSIDEALAL